MNTKVQLSEEAHCEVSHELISQAKVHHTATDRRAGQTSDLDKREVLDVIDVDVIEVY
jgi:hypothetical protein